ncbi:hypothetical protein [Hydrogenophaga sp. BPS33]|uniref:hypothetical protein n=1 Tax=Hydrogenophaga sp. BPS33 TaxID=2651974 RepID=UPI00131FB6A3|nr:hypothetical protein [Hydrogenophaga sp. BPS33]QHE83760.1 hypothetical protein F9K07_02120 [Hydrogenophaga sp. BPS33]
MPDLSESLQQSYHKHPAFRFDAPSWTLSETQLNAFNSIYVTMRGIGAAMSSRAQSTLRQESQEALAAVFTALKTQGEDPHELAFLAELESNCNTLLQDELNWYTKPTRPGHFQLGGELARMGAHGMQTSRHFFGQLRPDAVQSMQRLAAPEVERFRANARAHQLKRTDLSISTGPTVRALRAQLNQEFRALGVLDAVSAYTGRKTQVIGLALELSVPQATWWRNAIPGLDHPPATLYAHLDETISCPKSIVYLSSVTEQNGPTSCYPGAYEAMHMNPLQEMVGRVIGNIGTRAGSPLQIYYGKQYHQSMNSDNFRRHFMRLPPSLRFNSHLGWDVMPGSEAEAQLAQLERKMTGPAGTFIAFDGARLLHRGGLMEAGERIALQVIFSDVTWAERVLSKAKRMLS